MESILFKIPQKKKQQFKENQLPERNQLHKNKASHLTQNKLLQNIESKTIRHAKTAKRSKINKHTRTHTEKKAKKMHKNCKCL